MILKVIARLIGRGVKQIADHKVSSALILLLLVALVFVSTARFSGPSGVQASQKTGVAPTSTEQYFKGQTNFDSNLIWQSLSPSLIERAQMSGATVEALQEQLDEAKQLGRSYEDIAYIGGYNLNNGKTMQFYVVTVRRSPTDSNPDQIFYVFTLDESGKIMNIE
ncbi:MAG: hypothetical protein M0T85_05190 [Dehalococcoidales bacterium]|nr:hypothetical protein [Dehalococcoidales bacterium]